MNLKTRIDETDKLLKSIKDNLPALDELLKRSDDEEDLVYRFYHESFKVYYAQHFTMMIVTKLQELAPHLPLNPWFMEIVRAGTGRRFSEDDDSNWVAVTRPMLEAYWHARYFLRMACKYGKELETAPNVMESGWAGLLYLFDLL